MGGDRNAVTGGTNLLRRALSTSLALTLLASACSLGGGDEGPDPMPVAARFASAWSDRDLVRMAEETTSGGREIDLAIRQFNGTLQIASTDASVDRVEVDDDSATAFVKVEHVLAGLGSWDYVAEVPLVRTEEDWAVEWSTAVLHPEFTDGRRLVRDREIGTRAPILDRSGRVLARGDAEARTATVAPLTIGRVGTIDQTTAAESGPTVAAGDVGGLSGLERSYDVVLSGEPRGAIRLTDSAGGTVADLASFEGTEPEPLTTTLDSTVQRAADAAVAGSALPTALVVLDAETGAVRAVANNPPGFDRSFLGEYPPGSTFKVITASAMLADGVGADDRLPCPAETRPGDARPFTNAFGKDGGVVTFRSAFAQSCNTTFVDEGFRLGGETLQAAAEQYGFNSGFNPGIPAVVGKYPLPESDTELAASAIGQGRVSASPLHMASVAAAARTGAWHAPFLVEPTPELDQQFPEGEARTLTDFMRAVVLDEEDGTATNVAVDGYEVGGKTGTAEFGDEEPPETHAWFIGFVDDLAYAVVVEGGGVGGSVAGPIARSFIEGLPRQPADDAPPASPPTTAVG